MLCQEVASIVYCSNWEIILESFLESSDLEAGGCRRMPEATQSTPSVIRKTLRITSFWTAATTSFFWTPRPSGRPAGRYCRPSQFVACKRAKSALRKLCASPETGISRVDFPKTGGLALWRNLKALHTAEDCFPIRLLAKAAFAGPCTDLGLDYIW